MKKLITLAMSSLFAINSYANTLDVKPAVKLKSGDHYVRVTKLKEGRVKIEKCISGYEDNNGCNTLGHKDSYSLQELRSQRTTENIEIGLSVVGDVAAIVAFEATATYAAEYVAEAAGEGAFSFIAAHFLVGIPTGLVGAGVSMHHLNENKPNPLNALNPFEQARQAKALEEEVINDKNVYVGYDEIDEYIERLDLVLSKIEANMDDSTRSNAKETEYSRSSSLKKSSNVIAK